MLRMTELIYVNINKELMTSVTFGMASSVSFSRIENITDALFLCVFNEI